MGSAPAYNKTSNTHGKQAALLHRTSISFTHLLDMFGMVHRGKGIYTQGCYFVRSKMILSVLYVSYFKTYSI